MSSNAPRFAYFGLPLGALALLGAGFTPHVVVLGHTGAPGQRRLRRLLGPQTPVFERPEPGDPRIAEALVAARTDTILSWFYPKQIPAGLLGLAPRGAFGAHPSLLPRWRGPDPYFWAIYRGDPETGVTLHRLEPEYDTGAIIAQRRLAVGEEEHALGLARRLDRPGLELLVWCAQRLAEGAALTGTPQAEVEATLAPTPEEALLAIDWSRPAAEIVRLVRAAAPFPGATAALGDALVEVVEARAYPHPLPRALEPADAVWSPLGLVVKAADGGVLVRRARLEDGALLTGARVASLFPAGLARVGGEIAVPGGPSGRTEG